MICNEAGLLIGDTVARSPMSWLYSWVSGAGVIQMMLVNVLGPHFDALGRRKRWPAHRLGGIERTMVTPVEGVLLPPAIVISPSLRLAARIRLSPRLFRWCLIYLFDAL